MVCRAPAARLPMDAVLGHPAFWSPAAKLEAICGWKDARSKKLKRANLRRYAEWLRGTLTSVNDPTQRVCAGCRNVRLTAAFSKSQLAKKARGRCESCVREQRGEAPPTPFGRSIADIFSAV